MKQEKSPKSSKYQDSLGDKAGKSFIFLIAIGTFLLYWDIRGVKSTLPVQQVSAFANITINNHDAAKDYLLQEALHEKEEMMQQMKLELEQKDALLKAAQTELELKSELQAANGAGDRPAEGEANTEETKEEENKQAETQRKEEGTTEDSTAQQEETNDGSDVEETKETKEETQWKEESKGGDRTEQVIEQPEAPQEQTEQVMKQPQAPQPEVEQKPREQTETENTPQRAAFPIAIPRPTPSSSTGPKKWIHVVQWAEGMAAWRESFTELMSVAHYLGASLVEPCVYNGRLNSCREEGDTSLEELFDMAPFRHIVVPHWDFVQQTGYSVQEAERQLLNRDSPVNGTFKVFPSCINKMSKWPCKYFKTKSTYRAGDQPGLDKGLAAINDPSYPHEHGILQILDYRKWGLSGWHPDGVKPAEREKRMFMAQLRFPQSAWEKVQGFLKILNITATDDQKIPKFAAFQWRPELDPMDHWECAQGILRSRDIIVQQTKIPKENFILMSPLSHRKELMWKGVATIADKEGSRAYESLQLLFDNGFKKLEQAFGQEVADGSSMIVWDMILATYSESFTTCKKCGQNNLCSRCNYQGSAAGLFMTTRAQMHRGKKALTNHCWPE